MIGLKNPDRVKLYFSFKQCKAYNGFKDILIRYSVLRLLGRAGVKYVKAWSPPAKFKCDKIWFQCVLWDGDAAWELENRLMKLNGTWNINSRMITKLSRGKHPHSSIQQTKAINSVRTYISVALRWVKMSKDASGQSVSASHPSDSATRALNLDGCFSYARHSPIWGSLG